MLFLENGFNYSTSLSLFPSVVRYFSKLTLTYCELLYCSSAERSTESRPCADAGRRVARGLRHSTLPLRPRG